MITVNTKVELPAITIATAFLFLASFCFKVGEAVFFGYPTYYISLDFPSVINVSLKLLAYFVFVYGALIWLFDDVWKLKRKTFKYVMIAMLFFEAISWFYKLKHKTFDFVSYLDGGLVAITSFIMVFIGVEIFRKESDGIKINGTALIGTVILMSFSSFLAGINYHNQIGSTLWKSKEGKYVIGEYKGSLILKECKNGEGVFTLKEPKDIEFTEASVDVTTNVKFRCKKTK